MSGRPEAVLRPPTAQTPAHWWLRHGHCILPAENARIAFCVTTGGHKGHFCVDAGEKQLAPTWSGQIVKLGLHQCSHRQAMNGGRS